MVEDVPGTAVENIVVVLHRPQQVVNIGGTVRAMKNMGFRHLRLVEPVPFAPDEITRLAHRSEDVLAAARSYASLDAALADTVYVVGTTDHVRGNYVIRQDIGTIAPNILQWAQRGTVALLFGAEDNGLPTAALDRCHMVLRLPTDPAYPALNLAQAVLLLLYELRRTTSSTPIATTAGPPPATGAQYETLFAVWEQALGAIGFFKMPRTESTMRRLRAVLHRATLDQQEAALLTAMAREVVRFLQRKQPDDPEC
jgi:TrmH family RNA methyltransferase